MREQRPMSKWRRRNPCIILRMHERPIYIERQMYLLAMNRPVFLSTILLKEMINRMLRLLFELSFLCDSGVCYVISSVSSTLLFLYPYILGIVINVAKMLCIN